MSVLFNKGEKLEQNHYTILKELGVGGMGVVYHCRDEQLMRDVAIKMLLPELMADKNNVEIFQQEARLAAQLEHPHVVRVYDIGVEERQRKQHHYVCMEYLPGGNLAHSLSSPASRSVESCLNWMKQLASGLAFAHKRGVIHQDIKADNIFLTNEGDLKIGDFGLARLLVGRMQVDSTIRGMGTPAYMSPELCRGEQQDHRSDIYSLGVLFFEMATGQLPYRARGMIEMATKHSSAPIPSVRRINPAVPEVLEKMIRRMMGKLPEERYASMSEVLNLLDDLIFELRVARIGLTTHRPTMRSGPIMTERTGIDSGTNKDALPFPQAKSEEEREAELRLLGEQVQHSQTAASWSKPTDGNSLASAKLISELDSASLGTGGGGREGTIGSPSRSVAGAGRSSANVVPDKKGGQANSDAPRTAGSNAHSGIHGGTAYGTTSGTSGAAAKASSAGAMNSGVSGKNSPGTSHTVAKSSSDSMVMRNPADPMTDAFVSRAGMSGAHGDRVGTSTASAAGSAGSSGTAGIGSDYSYATSQNKLGPTATPTSPTSINQKASPPTKGQSASLGTKEQEAKATPTSTPSKGKEESSKKGTPTTARTEVASARPDAIWKPSLRQIWTAKTLGPIGWSSFPIVDREEKHAFVASTDATLYCLDLSTGAKKWQFSSREAFFSAPRLLGESIFVADSSGTVFSLNRQTGALQWKSKLSASVVAAPTSGNDVLCVATTAGDFVAMDVFSGSSKWRYRADGPIHCSPYRHGSTLFFGTKNGSLQAVSERDGRLLWTCSTGGPIVASPAGSVDSIYFGNMEGLFYALSVENGGLIWAYQTDGPIVSKAVVAFTSVIFCSQDKWLYSCEKYDGSLKWKAPVRGRLFADLVVHRDVVIVATQEGWLQGFHSRTGALVWQKHLGCELESPPVIAGDLLLQATIAGDILALSTETLATTGKTA